MDDDIKKQKAEQRINQTLPERDVNSHWKKVLPNYSPRKTQEEVMKWINSLPSEVKYILCEIPVGGGKSPLAIAYSSYINGGLGSAYILTPQKTLQKQYEDSFSHNILQSIYGKANYNCNKKQTNCDIGSDIKPKCSNCPARQAFDSVKTATNVVLNYSLALSYFCYVREQIPCRDVMIFDECHALEHHLVEFGSINITAKKCKKYNVSFKVPRSLDEAFDWLKNKYQPALNTKLQALKSDLINIENRPDESITPQDEMTIKDYKGAIDHSRQVAELLSCPRDIAEKKYVLVSDKSYFKFKELYAKNNFRNLCLPKANRFLFLSSTILDKEQFCKDLGIESEEAAFISVDSEFDVKNRPVYYKPVMKMTYGWDNDDNYQQRQVMLGAIMNICNFHKNESGIIHTGNYKITEWLFENLYNKIPHTIYQHLPDSGISRDVAIEKYLTQSSKKPSILISPSITEGMDLMDDRGRFAIIAKVPYPYIGDAWIKRRMEISKGWYNRRAIVGIIQGSGRIVRSKEDKGTVYILDESFTFLYNKTKSIIPQWWKDGLVVL